MGVWQSLVRIQLSYEVGCGEVAKRTRKNLEIKISGNYISASIIHPSNAIGNMTFNHTKQDKKFPKKYTIRQKKY